MYKLDQRIIIFYYARRNINAVCCGVSPHFVYRCCQESSNSIVRYPIYFHSFQGFTLLLPANFTTPKVLLKILFLSYFFDLPNLCHIIHYRPSANQYLRQDHMLNQPEVTVVFFYLGLPDSLFFFVFCLSISSTQLINQLQARQQLTKQNSYYRVHLLKKLYTPQIQ